MTIVFRRKDRVVLACDPRHAGEVAESIGVRVAVRWDESGWLSEHRPSELHREGAELKRRAQ